MGDITATVQNESNKVAFTDPHHLNKYHCPVVLCDINLGTSDLLVASHQLGSTRLVHAMYYVLLDWVPVLAIYVRSSSISHNQHEPHH